MVLLKASTFASSVVLAALAYTACGPAKDAGSNVDGLYGGASGRGAAGSSNGFAGVGGSGLGGNAGSDRVSDPAQYPVVQCQGSPEVRALAIPDLPVVGAMVLPDDVEGTVWASGDLGLAG